MSTAPILPPDQQVSPLTPSEMDWDSLYEEEEEESEIDMKSQGSVITHLLSQVKIFLVGVAGWRTFTQSHQINYKILCKNFKSIWFFSFFISYYDILLIEVYTF